MHPFDLPVVDVLQALGRNVGLLALAAVAYAVAIRRIDRGSLAGQAVYGALFGAMTVLAMALPFEFAPGILVDGRPVMLALAGPFGGPLAAVLAALAAAAFRLHLGGVGAIAGVAGIVIAAGVGMIMAAVPAYGGRPLRLPHIFILAAVVSPLHLASALLLPDREQALRLLEATGPVALPVTTLGIAILGTLLIHEHWRRLGELALRDSEARYRLLAGNIGDVLTRISPDGTRTFCSEASRDVLGYEPEELIGRPADALVHPDDRPVFAAALSGLSPEAPATTCVMRKRHGNGHWIWTEASIRLVSDPVTGRPMEYIAVARDVTRRIHSEQEARAARDEAERANRAKSAFLAGVSQELVTPLNAIIGFTDSIARESLGPVGDPRYLQLALDARDSGQHLLELINDVLDHARADSGRLTLTEDTVDLDAAVSFCVRLIWPRAERAGVNLSYDVAPDVRHLRADEMRMRQILLNLLSNAVKYTPSGGRVTVSASLRDGQPVIVVADTGTDADRSARHSAANDDRATEESGFVLPLTRRLVELHGGTLAVASPGRGGMVATVRLPTERLTDAPARPAATVVPGGATILLVEDDPLIRFAAAELLAGFGHMVLQAGNANEALAVLREGRPIDLLFTDVVMPPGMNGAELAREVERLRPGIRVLLTSGFAGHAIVGEDGMGKGYEMLPKPFSPEDLKRKLDTMLAARSAPSATG
ncbi:ATP-binding protein [Azospirillum halopraeferens]|uniref:ATP-binding protein n=1 Tax=Azospirillum halopraeferens TaxID=34010 RepID=UPI000422C91B|nr:ATP-binding protein [Azospirillum halopraeferens]